MKLNESFDIHSLDQFKIYEPGWFTYMYSLYSETIHLENNLASLVN